MLKKTVSVLLAALMAFGLMTPGAIQAFAAEADTQAVADGYTALVAGTVLSVNSDGNEAIYTFTPAETRSYTFYTTGSCDTVGELYDPGWGFMGNNDDDEDYNFVISAALTAGQTYFLKVWLYSGSGSFDLHVEADPYAVSMVIDAGESYSGYAGTEVQLNAVFSPENAYAESVTWTSSDPAVVSVDSSGSAALLAMGSAVITAASERGLTAQCSVTVKDYESIAAGQTKTAVIDAGGSVVCYRFVPSESGFYTFFSSGSEDTYGELCDADMEQITNDDDGGENGNFKLSYELTQGEAYYYIARYYSDYITGSFSVTLQRNTAATGLAVKEGNITGYPGTEIQLHADFLPAGAFEQDVTWRISSGTAASVSSSGYLTLLHTGTAVVEAVTESGLSATCTVTVRDYEAIALNEEKTVTINHEYEEVVFVFVPAETGTYAFYSTGTENTWGAILDSSKDLLVSGYSGGSGDNFKIQTTLTAGETYYLKARLDVFTEPTSFVAAIQLAEDVQAEVIEAGETKLIDIDEEGKKALFRFTPHTTGQYLFRTSETNEDQRVTLYDADMSPFRASQGCEIFLTQSLTAGSTFYFECGFADAGDTGSFTAVLQLCPAASAVTFRNGNTLSGFVGVQSNVYVDFLPENAVEESLEWTSSNTGVVAVSDTYANSATLQFRAVGTATVTVTSENGLTATLTVNVREYETLASGETKTAVIENNGDAAFYKIIPAKNGCYAFSSSSDKDTFGTLYDANMNTIDYDDDSGSNTNFRIRTTLSAGETYYLEARFYGNSNTGSFPVTMEEVPTVTEMTLLSLPSCTTYYEGAVDDYLSYDGLSLRILWSDGMETVSNYSYDFNVRGEDIELYRNGTTVTVVCGDASVTFDIEILENPVASLEVSGAITEIENAGGYWDVTYTGDPFYHYSLNSLYNKEVTVHYKDGTSKTAFVGDKPDGFAIVYRDDQCETPFTRGSNTVIISYLGVTASVNVTVAESPVAGIEVLGQPARPFVEHSNGEWYERYNDETHTAEQYFYYNYSYELYGIPVRITFKDGTVTEAAYGDTVNGYEITGTANQSVTPWTVGSNNLVTVSYMGVEAPLYVTVIETPVQSLELIHPSERVLYENVDGYFAQRYDPDAGDFVEFFSYSLSLLDDLQVKIYFKDGSTAIASPYESVNDYTLTLTSDQAEAPFTVGDNPFTISYLGVSCQATATVVKDPVDHLELIHSTAATLIENGDGYYDYRDGERVFFYNPLDLSDAEIKICYADGTFTTAHIGDVIDGYRVHWSSDQDAHPWTVGSDNYLTIVFMFKEVRMPITVVPSPAVSLVINSAPTRQYLYGDPLFGGENFFDPDDMTGLRFTVGFSDGSSRTYTDADIEKGNRIDGHPFAIEADRRQTVGVMPVTFSYMGKTAAYNITVSQNTASAVEVVRLPDDPSYSQYYSPDFRGMQIKITNAGESTTVTLNDSNILYGFNNNIGFYVGFAFNGTICYITEQSENNVRRFFVNYAGLRSEITGLTCRTDKTVADVAVEDFSLSAENMLLKVTYQDGTTENIRLTDIKDHNVAWMPDAYLVRALTGKGVLPLYIYNPAYKDMYTEGDLLVFGINVKLQDTPQTTYIRGDVNGDGSVTVEDATRLQMYFAEYGVPNVAQLLRCGDANADGSINIKDVTAIQRYLADIDTDLSHIGEAI